MPIKSKKWVLGDKRTLSAKPSLKITNENTVLAMLAAVGSAVAQALGGWDVALKVLICFMALDYVTGWLVAAVWHKSAKSKTGARWTPRPATRGLVKKGIMLALVWMAALLDQATHSDFVRDAVCLFSSPTKAFPYWRIQR